MRLLRALPFLALVAIASAQGDSAVVNRVLAESKANNQATALLDELCHKIGPRVTGSPGLIKAQKWAVGKFKGWGLKNVHLDPAYEIPVGFDRGPSSGRIAYPENTPLVFSTNNWAQGTRGKVKAKVALEPKTVQEVESNKASLTGAWVLCTGDVAMRGPNNTETPEVREALNKLGIAGRVFGAPAEIVWSHGKYSDKTFEKHSTEVDVTLRRSDFDKVKKLYDEGKKPELEFKLDNRWIKGPLQQYNVVADILGTEHPEEMVIISGHLDSWNTPGSQGATDDGTGVVKAMEAARLLMKAGAKPKRTIRFLLFCGEEQGLLGSAAYVKNHASEMDKISAVLNDDGGTGWQSGYLGYEPMRAIVEQAFAPMNAAYPDKQLTYGTTADLAAGGGSDHHSFAVVGVPALWVRLTGTKVPYRETWHTQNDRFENAVPEFLAQASTNSAVVSYNLACAATMLPRNKN